MDIKKWRFASYNNAGDDGINDAGIETFSSKAEVANIREVIQNSIDQISDEAQKSNLPVIVEFEDFYIEPTSFPGYEDFSEILDKCIESSKNNDMVKKFFNQSKELLNKEIRVLRISDYNTTGLEGAEDDNRSKSWHNLIKSKGHSNKNMSSGGSFGIGKSAPFTCSGLRTVFYASKVEDIESYVGVARLISFEDETGLTLGTGYYTENELLRAILEPFCLSGFKRTTNGTDIYIMGYDGEEDLEKVIKETTLENFFVTIYKNKLKVRYKELEINSDNLGQYISELDDKDFLETKIYYDMLNSYPTSDDEDEKRIVLDSNEFGKKYGILDGEATLLLRKADDLNRRILMTRKPGMSLFLQGGISGSISFTGLLLIEGDKMNSIFKNMEVPAHDAWKPEKCKLEKKMYMDAYKDLKKYLKDKVVQYFGQTNEERISAYGMDEFFSNSSIESGEHKINVLDGKVKTDSKKHKNNKRKKKKVTIKSGGEDISAPSYEPAQEPTETLTPSTTPISIPSRNPSPKTDKYKYVDLKKWLMCRNEKQGEYSITFKVDKKKKKVKLDFFAIAEKGVYPLEIKEILVAKGNASIDYRLNNSVYLSNLSNKEPVILNFKIDFNFKCMMEVEYYEVR